MENLKKNYLENEKKIQELNKKQKEIGKNILVQITICYLKKVK